MKNNWITKIKHLALLFAIGVAVNSCDMEQEVYDKITVNFPKTEADVKALVSSSAYNVFSPRKMLGAAHGYHMLSDMLSDVGFCSWGNWEDLEYNTYEVTHPLLLGDRRLFMYYSSISAMTLNMHRIKDVEIDPKLIERYTAELKCGRGMLAFMLYDLYGPLPIADLETLLKPQDDIAIPRLSEAEMYTFIELNLLEAAEVLPEKYKDDANYGRFTSGLAKTVLMKFYMMKGDWDKAVKIGEDIVDGKVKYGYDLVADYNSLFSLSGEINTEVIFASRANFDVVHAQNQWLAHVLPGDWNSAPTLSKWGGYKMTWQFYDSYKASTSPYYSRYRSDKRFNRIMISYVGKGEDGKTYTVNRANGLTGAIPYKYDYLSGAVGSDSEIDIPVYRFADVMTLYGEALVRKDGAVSPKAVTLLNSLRSRAGNTVGTNYNPANVNEYLECMLMERGLEFYYEGCRRQDLIRHGKFIDKAMEKAEAAGHSTNKIATMVDGVYKYHRLPIPNSVIVESRGAIKQNPGY